MLKNLSFIFIFFLFGLLVQAQSYLNQTQCVSMEDGLSNAIVNDAYQDSKGFIWLATNNGLNRYDGYNIKVYKQKTHGLSANKINNILEDQAGNLWLGIGELYGTISQSYRAVNVLNPQTGQVSDLKDYLSTSLPFEINDIWNLSMNADHSIWIMTKSGLLYNYQNQSFKQFFQLPAATFFPENGGLWTSNQGTAWISLSQKSIRDAVDLLIYFDTKNGQILETYSAPLGESFHTISLAKNGKLYFEQKSISKEGQIQQQLLSKKAFEESQSIKFSTEKTYLNSRYFPNLNQIWAYQTGKKADTIDVFDPLGNYLTSFDKSETMGYDNVAWEDQQGGIWTIEGFHNHVCVRHLNKSLFQKHLYAQTPSETRYATRGCYCDESNQWCYVSGAYQVFMWNRVSKKQKTINLYPHIPLAIHKGLSDNYIYVSDEDGGISILEGDKVIKRFENPYQKDKGNMLWAVHEDERGVLWIGSSKGLLKLDKNGLNPFENYGNYSQLQQTEIYHFYPNEKGLWLATNNGLFLMDLASEQIIAHYQKENKQLPHNNITHIQEDKAGFFWMSSKGGGLIKWHPQTGETKQYTTTEGLSHNVTYCVYEDDYDNLWISSDYGLMRFNKPNQTVHTYHKRDGITHEEFNTISHYQLKDGSFLMGGLNGLNQFDPNQLHVQKNIYKPQFRITSIKKENPKTGFLEEEKEDISTISDIYLQPNEKSLEIYFALLDFKTPETNTYAYKIQESDKQWIYTKQPFIRFNNLAYGRHTIILKAQGSNGVWLEKELQLKIHVTRPFYLQTWFTILSILLSIVLIISVFQWRIRVLRRRKVELEKIVENRTLKIQQQTEELKALDRLKSRFFTNISHELRTPLTLILGPLSAVLDDPQQLSTQQLQHLNSMQRNGKSLLKLVEEILDLSKLDANKLELQEEIFSFQAYIESIFKAFAAQADYQQIHYQLKNNLEAQTIVQLDGNKTEKIINNLLSNAVKFTARGGSITVSTFHKDNCIHIQVQDTGSGIHSKDIPYVFDRFYQSKLSNRPAQGGTGVGLALSQELAGLMSGRLTVESVYGQGSTFTLILPDFILVKNISQKTPIVQQKNADMADAKETNLDQAIIFEPQQTAKKSTILLVEDNNDMRAFVESLLVENFEVIRAENGLLALAELQKEDQNIDLILSDIMMPQMDGFELLQAIKEHDLWQRIPVVMLTAKAQEKDKLQALRWGVDDYITKPFSKSELLVRIQNLLYNYQQRKAWQAEEKIAEPIDQVKKEEGSTKTDSIAVVDQEWIDELEGIIKQELNNEQFTVASLSNKLNMSKRQLERRIKKIIGLSPAKYIREIRLQVARSYFEDGNFRSVSEVSYAVGFLKTQYFSKLYKERFGKKPSNYI